jgi:hypothetical protein
VYYRYLSQISYFNREMGDMAIYSEEEKAGELF